MHGATARTATKTAAPRPLTSKAPRRRSYQSLLGARKMVIVEEATTAAAPIVSPPREDTKATAEPRQKPKDCESCKEVDALTGSSGDEETTHPRIRKRTLRSLPTTQPEDFDAIFNEVWTDRRPM